MNESSPKDVAALKSESAAPIPPQKASSNKTRIGTAWVMSVSFILGLVLLLVFILQNLQDTTIHLFTWSWEIPLGVAMLLAAVVGGFLVALFGTARVVQLGRSVKRSKK